MATHFVKTRTIKSRDRVLDTCTYTPTKIEYGNRPFGHFDVSTSSGLNKKASASKSIASTGSAVVLVIVPPLVGVTIGVISSGWGVDFGGVVGRLANIG